MADNFLITQGAGTTIAADDNGGALYQRVKMTWGADGSFNEVAAATPMPVTLDASYAEDAAHTTADKGIFILSRRIDTLASSAGTTADYASINTDANGRVYTYEQPVAADGMLPLTAVLGATTTGTTTLTAAATLHSLTIDNGDSAAAYVKIYDKATAATGSDTPIGRYILGAGVGRTITFGRWGLKLAAGLSIRSVTESTDAGTTSPTAGKVMVQGTYK